jgi:serine phosphatase RsbU (regulator of sigma subunit)
MLRFRDFFHLPQVDGLIKQVAASPRGMILAAGLDPRLPAMHAGESFLPAGRSTVFQILLHEMLSANPNLSCLALLQEKDGLRVPRALRAQVSLHVRGEKEDLAELIRQAGMRGQDVLVIDQLDGDTCAAALEAAALGLRVLTQMDTVLRGASVLAQLADWGVPPERLEAVAWVVSVQRMPQLCARCRQPVDLPAGWLNGLADEERELCRRSHFYQPGQCESCRGTGFSGDVAAFDLWQGGSQPGPTLRMEHYVLSLAAEGYLPPEEFFEFGERQLRRLYTLFRTADQAFSRASAGFQSKLLQLEAANRVLAQRTDALVSLQGLGQALIDSTGLRDLAARILRLAREMCSAERAALYYLHASGEAEVLAVTGWDAGVVGRRLPKQAVFPEPWPGEPTPYTRIPPGLPNASAASPLRAGLALPLVAQTRPVGFMIVQTNTKLSFSPSEVALLKTFANQASLALQRAGLIDELRQKVAALEAAQVELVQKERLEQEMALARQVQQNVLPSTFPELDGYAFAAYNEPARQVGGDFYDVIELGEGRYGLAIADVSDKGMPAALYMALTRSLLRAEARRETSPRRVVEAVNHLLMELGEPDMFVTLFYAVLDAPTGWLSFVRAGHEHPLLLRGGEALELGGAGMALGLQGELNLSEERVQLRPGDRLVLFTDGLIDVLPETRVTDRARLVDVLQSAARLPLEELCAEVFRRLARARAGGEQYDDMTLLVLGAR